MVVGLELLLAPHVRILFNGTRITTTSGQASGCLCTTALCPVMATFSAFTVYPSVNLHTHSHNLWSFHRVTARTLSLP